MFFFVGHILVLIQRRTTMSKIQTAVKVSINESALIRNLGSVFTDKTKVLAELLQNGRRAGATSINIEFEGDTLVVVDNGCGIDNMQNLLTVADSGWGEQTVAAESPFGMGFLSTLFTATSVKVESKGRQIAFQSSAAINLEKIEVKLCDFIGGTRVTLEGFDVSKERLEEALMVGNKSLPFCAGFPIPIFFNGKELARPLQKDDRFIECEIGHIRLFASKNEFAGSTICSSNYDTRNVFLQGLPVNAGKVPDYTVIHLNSQFAARMPDRDVLLDLDFNLKRITDVVTSEYRKFFEALKKTDPMSLFEDKYFGVISKYEFLDLFNDIDTVPANFFKLYSEYPTYENSFDNFKGADITRAQLESNEVFVMDDEYQSGDLGTKTMAVNMLAWKLNWPILKHKFHPDHWVMKMSLPRADDFSEEINVEGIDSSVEIILTNDKTYGDITLVDSYTVKYHGQSYTFHSDAVSIGEFGYDCSTVIVPEGEHSAMVLDQFNSWTDEFDSFDEDHRDEQHDEFTDRLAVLRGENSVDTLKKVFDYNDINNSNLLGKTFKVSFVSETLDGGSNGNHVVIEEIIS